MKASGGERVDVSGVIKIQICRDPAGAPSAKGTQATHRALFEGEAHFANSVRTFFKLRSLKKKITLAIIAAFALACAAPLQASEHRSVHGHATIKGPAVLYAHGRAPHGRARSGYFADLVGDPDSGAGFYPLPWVYRVGAWRAHQRQAYNSYNAIRFAIMSQAMYSYVFPYNDNRPGVFNPYDGYGTPFFAGYYGPGDPNAERGPFGRPYRN